jgi:hypothetical protein
MAVDQDVLPVLVPAVAEELPHPIADVRAVEVQHVDGTVGSPGPAPIGARPAPGTILGLDYEVVRAARLVEVIRGGEPGEAGPHDQDAAADAGSARVRRQGGAAGAAHDRGA